MERLNYTPAELREAFRYLGEAGSQQLCASHAGNWRTKFSTFIDAMMKNQEALRLLARLLDGHQRVSAVAWYRQAAGGEAPPLPSDRYERLALGWQLVSRAIPKSNPDGFDKSEKVDLPYVLVNSDLPGGSLGERFEEFRLRYLEPFVREFEAANADLLAAIPAGASSVDLWDAAIAAWSRPATADAPGPGALARAIEAERSRERAAPARAPAPPGPDPVDAGEGSPPAEAPAVAARAGTSKRSSRGGKKGGEGRSAKKKAGKEQARSAGARTSRSAKGSATTAEARGAEASRAKASKARSGTSGRAGGASPAGPLSEPGEDDTTRIRDMARRAKEREQRERRRRS